MAIRIGVKVKFKRSLVSYRAGMSIGKKDVTLVNFASLAED